MNRNETERIIALVGQCDAGAILRAASICDGHTIFKPEAFTEAGLPAEVVTHMTTTYRSDGTPKGTISVHGKPVKELSGVYGLDLLRFLADALGVKYARAMGRGSEAGNIQVALHQHFKQPPAT
jgi:hypothetical protein